MKHEKYHRVTVWLDPEYDVDPIDWLGSTPAGSRSTLIRAAWRAGLHRRNEGDPLDLEELRQVMAEELQRALAGRAMGLVNGSPDEPDNVVESEYSGKLDRMLGGLTQTRFAFADDE